MARSHRPERGDNNEGFFGGDRGMTLVRIGGGRVLTPDGSRFTDVTIKGDRIESVGPREDDREIDATGLIVSPGFIDLQINGGHGIDLADQPDAIWRLGAKLPRHGVTAFLPTIVSSPASTTDAAIETLHQRPDGYVGAEPLGLHLEGPMLNPKKRGAHNLDSLVLPDPSVIEGWSKRSGITLVTLAPELPGALSVIAELVERGVVVAAGHTSATSAQTAAAMAAGLSAVTHLFNAMAPFDHRNPSLLNVALFSPDLPVGLIADGVHVHPEVIAATWAAKGPSRIILVTDAVAAMGQPPGTYPFAGGTITADQSGVRNEHGVISGSNLTMDQAVRNLQAFTGCDPDEALLSATETPARLIRETHRGHIWPGATADLALLNDDLRVEITICAGRIVYISDQARSRLST